MTPSDRPRPPRTGRSSAAERPVWDREVVRFKSDRPDSPIPLQDLYWLAGWLEGEGSFLGGTPATPNRIRVASGCTDYDVVERAAKIMGTQVSNVRLPQKPHHKPSWGVTLTGYRAYLLMLQLRPLMGTRRKARIDEILAVHRPTPPRTHHHGTLAGYKRGCRCDPCRERKHREYVDGLHHGSIPAAPTDFRDVRNSEPFDPAEYRYAPTRQQP